MQVVWCCQYGFHRCADMLRHSILFTRPLVAAKKHKLRVVAYCCHPLRTARYEPHFHMMEGDGLRELEQQTNFVMESILLIYKFHDLVMPRRRTAPATRFSYDSDTTRFTSDDDGRGRESDRTYWKPD